VRIDAATAEVMRALADGGARAIVLKGPAIVAWLYADGGRRPYLDSDLLIRPADEGIAEAVLRKLGFEPRWDQSTMPDWWQEHGSEWAREVDGVLVDLHRSLPGVGVDDASAWQILSRETEPVPVAGLEAPALSLPGRALHVSLHAAQHGRGWGKGLADLERALQVADASIWIRAAAAGCSTKAGSGRASARRRRLLPRAGPSAPRWRRGRMISRVRSLPEF
jgi:hypothetical protein